MNRVSILTWLSAGVFACTPATNAETIYPPLNTESCIGVGEDTYSSLLDFEMLSAEPHEFDSSIEDESGAQIDCFLSEQTAAAASSQSNVTELKNDFWISDLTGFAVDSSGLAPELTDPGLIQPNLQLTERIGPPLSGTSLSSFNEDLWSISATDHLALADDLVDFDGAFALLLDAKGFSTGTTTVPPHCEITYLSEINSTGPAINIPELFASIGWLLPKKWRSDRMTVPEDVAANVSTTEQGPTSMAMVSSSLLPPESMFSPSLTVDGLLPMAFVESTVEETISYPVLRRPTTNWPFEPSNDDLPNSPFETDVISQAAVLGETGRDVVRGIMRHDEGLRFTLGPSDIIR